MFLKKSKHPVETQCVSINGSFLSQHAKWVRVKAVGGLPVCAREDRKCIVASL